MQPNDAPQETLNAFERPPWNRPWLWYLLAGAVLTADFFTSAYLLFPIFFIIPVLLVAWHGKLSHSLALVVVLCAARVAFHFHWGVPWGVTALVFNTVTRLIVLGLVAMLTSRVSHQTREMRRRVRMLEGMLPICGFCKDIRDDTGQWIQLESYITRHSEAQFSTGVCEKCGQKHLARFIGNRVSPSASSVYAADDLKDWPAATAGVRPPLRLAVFGDPVAHSVSPPMQNAALAARGIDARYTRIHVRPEELAGALALVARAGFVGVNLTIPHKTAAPPLLGSVDAHAAQLGAVNTVRVESDGSLRGFNTDGPGFVRAVRAEFGMELRGARVMVPGRSRWGGSGVDDAVRARRLPQSCPR